MGLIDKLKGFKKSLYMPLVAAGTLIASYTNSYAERVAETETFNGLVVKSHIPDTVDRWNVGPQALEATDFETTHGYLRYSFNDKLYNIQGKNMHIETEFEKDRWGATDNVGILIASDPLAGGDNGTYYTVTINAHPDSVGGHNFSIVKRSPGFTLLYFNALIPFVNGGGRNKLKVVGEKSTGTYRFFVNDNEINTTIVDEEGRIFTLNRLGFPKLEGYVGLIVFDGEGIFDAPRVSKTCFDNFRVEYDGPAIGGGGGGGFEVGQGDGGGLDLSQPHIPDIFLRGDPTRDGVIDIQDALATIKYIYTKPKSLRPRDACVDAMDVDDNGKLNASDPINILRHVYFQGDPLIFFQPLPPNLGGPGIDLTVDKWKCPRIE